MIFGFYHIAAIGPGWQLYAQQQIDTVIQSGLINKVEKIFVGTVGEVDNTLAIIGGPTQIILKDCSIQVSPVGNGTNQRTAYTLSCG